MRLFKNWSRTFGDSGNTNLGSDFLVGNFKRPRVRGPIKL
jgi:hypothetical protein